MQVPMVIQEQNFEILKEKYGLERNDDTMKIRYCNNCEDKFKSNMKCVSRGRWGSGVVLLALVIIILASALGSSNAAVPTYTEETYSYSNSTTEDVFVGEENGRLSLTEME